MTSSARRGATVIGALLVAIGLVGMWSALRGGHPPLAMLVVGSGFVVAGVLVAANALTSRLAPDEDELRVTHLFSTRVVKRDAVVGRGLIRARWLGDSRYFVLDPAGRETQFPPNLTYDRAFHAYIGVFSRL